MAQRISRAKASIRSAGARFEAPGPQELPDRLAVVLHALYLVFNEGYVSTAGAEPQRTDLAAEAIRLARLVHRLLPEEGEAAGLLALLLLTDARSAARSTPAGELVPLAEQDRTLWDHRQIAEGVSLLTRTLGRGPAGAYQLQAAIAAVHDEAERARGDRLAADPRALLSARARRARAGRHPQPGGRGGDGPRPPGGARTARHARRTTRAWRRRTAWTPSAGTCSSSPGSRRQRARPTCAPRGAPRASPSSAISGSGRRRWRGSWETPSRDPATPRDPHLRGRRPQPGSR